jgi:threonine-phosphate decarboxylase
MAPFAPWRRLFEHGGAVVARRPLLDFSASINPLGPSPAVLLALQHALPAIAHYPEPRSATLVRRLAQHHNIEPERIVVGNGSSELIQFLPRLFEAKHAAIVEPTYTEYLRACSLAGVRVTHWLPSQDAGFAPEPFDPQGAEVVWLGNPNNPTGQLWPRGALASWVEAHRNVGFVVDESFLPFRDDEKEHTLVPLAGRLRNLVVLRSMTKVHALPGLRLGYAILNELAADRLRESLVPWSVNVLAQAAGLAALEDIDFLERTRRWLREELPEFTSQLQTCGSRLRPLPSQANFLLLRLHRFTGAELTARLAERGIAIRDASNFPGLDDRYVRVAVRWPEENRRLVAELRTLLAEE